MTNPKKIELPKCIFCGAEYLPKMAIQKVCGEPDCKRKLNKRKVTEYRRRQQEIKKNQLPGLFNASH